MQLKSAKASHKVGLDSPGLAGTSIALGTQSNGRDNTLQGHIAELQLFDRVSWM